MMHMRCDSFMLGSAGHPVCIKGVEVQWALPVMVHSQANVMVHSQAKTTCPRQIRSDQSKGKIGSYADRNCCVEARAASKLMRVHTVLSSSRHYAEISYIRSQRETASGKLGSSHLPATTRQLQHGLYRFPS